MKDDDVSTEKMIHWVIEDEAGTTSIFARNLPEALHKFEERLAVYPGYFETLDFLSIAKSSAGTTSRGKVITEALVPVEEKS